MSLEDTETEKMAAAFRKLITDPEVGSQAKRLYKKVVPDAKFADIELEDKIAESTKAMQEKIDKLQEEDMARRVFEARAKNHAFIREQGLEPEAVEKVMTEEKIASYDTAVKYMKGQNALAPPSPANITPIRMPEATDEIRKNPAKWAREQAFAAFNEIKARRGF